MWRVTGSLERSEARAARCEMDLSGGTRRSPRRVRAGVMNVTVLFKVSLFGVFEDLQLLFCELAAAAFGE